MVKIFNVTDSCILAVSTFMLFVMSILTVKVFRLVRFNDNRLLIMLTFLILSLICTIYIFIDIIIARVIFGCIRLIMRNKEGFALHITIWLAVTMLPVYLFSIAVTLNISKWSANIY